MKTYNSIQVFTSGNAVRVRFNGVLPGQSFSSGAFILVPEPVADSTATHGIITFQSNQPGVESFRVPSANVQNSGGTALGANLAAVCTALDSLFFLASGGGGGATTLDGLTDVEITTPATGGVLRYNGTLWTDADDPDDLYVKLDGAESIDGVKTFIVIPVLPAANPTTDNQAARKAYVDAKVIQSLIIPFSDEATTDITTGTAKITFYMPYAMTLTEVPFVSLTTASTGTALTVDVNEADVSILSTKVTVDAGELTSGSAATPGVLSDTSLASKAKITVDVDGVGTGARGGKIMLVGYITV